MSDVAGSDVRLVTTQLNVYTVASREQSHPVTCVQLPVDRVPS